ncbi:DUF819 domain-containing protein [Victivallis sp. Marseille-Q1083]|uniref:DUF819 family protein n=1 Tax=Victivallis sp. Marseille-Q1083 TaxID=2717288 RepID=UPI0015889A7F|nr:DUF819 family protein [Victivallis sp. Marseille-Q1083]
MIQNGFSYLALLVFLAGGLKILEERVKGKWFEYVPAVVCLYLLTMLLGSSGLWEMNEEIRQLSAALQANLMPAMLFLMLLKSDLRRIVRLGGRLLLAFFIASFSIAAGFILTFALFRSLLEPDSWKAFAALCGSWIGGSANMMALKGMLEVPNAQFGYTLLMDSVDYSLWLMVLLALVPYAHKFNRWTRADSGVLEEITRKLEREAEHDRRHITFGDLIFLLGLGLGVAAVAQLAGSWLPVSDYIRSSTWTVLLVTVAGCLLAMTPIGKLPGTLELSNTMLYILIALIGSMVNLSELQAAPLYIALGLVIIAFHALIMAGAARLLRFDLFTCGVASLANIGGVASATIIAATYSPVLIPVGVLMAMLGFITGTGVGMLVGRILSLL